MKCLVFSFTLSCLFFATNAHAGILEEAMAVALQEVDDSSVVPVGERTIRLSKTDYGSVNVVITDIGLPDDSVRGQSSHFIVSPTQVGPWKVVFRRDSYLCARGEYAGQWTYKLCP